MDNKDEQMEIDLGDTPKVEAKVEEDPVIEIIDENAPETPVVEAKEPAKTKVVDEKDPEEALKTLQKKLDSERKAREEAERRAQAAAGEVSETNMHLVATAIETVSREQDMLKAQLRDAMAIGDFDKAADIQAAMVANTTNLKQLERGFEEMKNQPRQPVQPMPRQEITVDDLIDKVTPRSAEWLRSNREAIPDTRAIRIMGRAHEDAIDMGIIPESDEYFRFVEGRLGIGKQEQRYEDASSGAAKPVKSRQSPPAAPVSREPVGASSRPGTIRLTAAEVEAAKISGISPAEYYKNKLRDQNRLN
jgi:hypothetical protein